MFRTPDQWPSDSNLTVVTGKALPLLLQTPEIRAIIRAGIELMIQDILFDDAFPNDEVRAKNVVHNVKTAAKKLGFKDVTLRVHRDIAYAETLASVVCCTQRTCQLLSHVCLLA